MTPGRVNSTPIGDSLQSHIDQVLTQIPTGKSGTVTGGISTTGATIGIGVNRKLGKLDLKAGGWAGKSWGGSGWDAGATAAIVF